MFLLLKISDIHSSHTEESQMDVMYSGSCVHMNKLIKLYYSKLTSYCLHLGAKSLYKFRVQSIHLFVSKRENISVYHPEKICFYFAFHSEATKWIPSTQGSK